MAHHPIHSFRRGRRPEAIIFRVSAVVTRTTRLKRTIIAPHTRVEVIVSRSTGHSSERMPGEAFSGRITPPSRHRDCDHNKTPARKIACAKRVCGYQSRKGRNQLVLLGRRGPLRHDFRPSTEKCYEAEHAKASREALHKCGQRPMLWMEVKIGL